MPRPEGKINRVVSWEFSAGGSLAIVGRKMFCEPIMTTKRERLRRMCCVHEVAHAIACLDRGIPFAGVEIFDQGKEPDVLVDGRSIGVLGGRVETVGDWTLSESAEDMMVMLLAGPASTRKLTHKSWFAVNVVGSGSGDYDQAVEIATLRYGEKLGEERMEICEDDARRLVAKEWKTILRIADSLVDRSYLSYSDFAVLREALASPEPSE